MNEKLYCYLAGFFDGEGSVSIVHQKSPSKNNPFHAVHRLAISVSNTDKSIIEFVKTFTKLGTTRSKKVSLSTPSNAKTIYQWQCWGPSALKFLKLVYPYLKVKKEESKLGIAFQKKLSSMGKNPLTSREWTVKFCEKLRNLNHFHGAAHELIHCKYKDSIKELNIYRICPTCNRRFELKDSYRKHSHWKAYCSKECFSQYQQTIIPSSTIY